MRRYSGFARTDRGQALYRVAGDLGVFPSEVLARPRVEQVFLFEALAEQGRREDRSLQGGSESL